MTATHTHKHRAGSILCQLSEGKNGLSSLMEPYILTENAQKFFNLIKLEAISAKANKSYPKLQAGADREHGGKHRAQCSLDSR